MLVAPGSPQPRTPEETAAAINIADRLLDEAEMNHPGFTAVYVEDFSGRIVIELQSVARDPKPGDVVGDTLYADRPMRANGATVRWTSSGMRVIDA
jgi:hypothetical protein